VLLSLLEIQYPSLNRSLHKQAPLTEPDAVIMLTKVRSLAQLTGNKDCFSATKGTMMALVTLSQKPGYIASSSDQSSSGIQSTTALPSHRAQQTQTDSYVDGNTQTKSVLPEVAYASEYTQGTV